VHSGATWVLWLMIGLSVVSLGIALDRAYALFRRQAGSSESLAADLNRLLEVRDMPKAHALLAGSKSVEASVVLAGLSLWDKGPEAVKEAMAAASGRERAWLEKRLGFLGTVGNNAPFVGLLGTVIGIVGAFDAMGKGGGTATGASLAPELVMANIAEALVATAVGLVVAIPVVAVYNYFTGAITRTMEAADTLGHVLLAHVEGGVDGGGPAYALLKPRTNANGMANSDSGRKLSADASGPNPFAEVL
jgi:biopolymer transport protein ExbB